MGDALHSWVQHSYAFLCVGVFASRLGLPIPAVPFLIAAGALGRSGEASLPVAIGLAAAAACAAHGLWYVAGRFGGRRVLNLVCKISLEPDACVRRTENVFARYGVKSLLVAPFIPGLGGVAHPLAGMLGVRLPRFVIFDLTGATIWAGTYVALGYVFGHQLVDILEGGAGLHSRLLALVIGVAIGYVGWKLLQRHLLLRRLRIGRIRPEELKERLEAGERVVILDLRHSLDVQADPRKIPGSIQIGADELEQRHIEIPRGQEIVLYCS